MKDLSFTKRQLKLSAVWRRPQHQTLGACVDQAVGFLKLLRSVHPVFQHTLWMNGTAPDELEQVADDLSNVESFVQRYGWSRISPKEKHQGLRADGTMSREGSSALGFTISMNSTRGTIRADTLSIRFRLGGYGPTFTSSASIEFPAQDAEEFRQLRFHRKLLQVVVPYWLPTNARVSDFAFWQKVLDRRSDAWPVVWLNYYDRSDACRWVPDDVICEPFGEAGSLLILQPEPPSGDDEAAVARALRVREALLPSGILAHGR